MFTQETTSKTRLDCPPSHWHFKRDRYGEVAPGGKTNNTLMLETMGVLQDSRCLRTSERGSKELSFDELVCDRAC